MCDYSLQHVKSRAAKIGDKLVTHNFGTGTTGFTDLDDPKTAVCLLPGTEIAFEVEEQSFIAKWLKRNRQVAIFRQINRGISHTHHDALEFPDGKVDLLTKQPEGRKAIVLQLPAAPKTKQEAREQERVAVVG